MTTKHNDEQAHRFFEHGIHIKGVTTVMRSAADLYQAWRGFTDLPRFIDHLRSVEPVAANGQRTRWTTRGPAGKELTWEADIINDEPGRRISWKSVQGGQVETAGTIAFAELPHGRGTRVDVVLEYVPPGGKLGAAAAKATGDDARTQVREALHRFRQMMETGEVANAKGQAVGAGRDDAPGGSDQRETDGNLRDVAGMETGR